MQVGGQGGTGKSFLIDVLSKALSSRKAGCVVKAAPTGIAANNIEGSTIYSLLHIPISRQITSIQDLGANQLNSIQNRMADVMYIILDEKSMIGLRMRHYIDCRLRQTFPAHQNEWFGGRIVLPHGDL